MGRNKVLQEMSEKIAKSAEDTMREFRQDTKPATGFEALEMWGREFETVDVNLKRKNDTTGKFELFSSQNGVLISDLMLKGPEIWCKEEGGRGEYEIEIVAPPKEPGKQPQRVKKGPVYVGGHEQLPVAKSEMNKLGMGGFLPWMSGLPTATKTSDSQLGSAMTAMVKQFGESAQLSSNQMMNFMVMQFMEKMFGQVNNQGNPAMGGANPQMQMLMEEVKHLRSERDRDRDRQATDDRFRSVQEQIAQLVNKLDGSGNDKALTLEIMKMREQASSKGEDNWLKYLTVLREADQAAQARIDSLLAKMLDRPDGSEQFTRFTTTMLESQVNTLNLVNQVVASGLGGSGEKSWKDVAGEVLETVQMGFAARYGIAPPKEGEEQLPIQTGPAQVLPTHQMGALPQGAPPQAPPQVEPEPDEEVDTLDTDPLALKILLLTEDELASMERDRAASQIFKAVGAGDYNQASARIFGLAYTNHSPYQRWFEFPGPLSGQILTHFKMPEHMLALTENIVQFHAHLGNGGDPNEWSDKYKPVKKKGGGVSSQLGPRPEFGLKRGEPPRDIRPVDPSVPPPGVDPALVEQQREERKRRAMIERLQAVRDNVELYRAGRLNKGQVIHLRKESQLPEDNEIDLFMEESAGIIVQLGGEVKKLEPEPAPQPEEKPESEEQPEATPEAAGAN